MSLIERAAAKLAGLGGAVGETQRREAPRNVAPSARDATDSEKLVVEAETRPVVPELAAPRDTSTGRPQVMRFRNQRVSSSNATNLFQSKRVDLDLAKLAESGLITPSAPRSQLASEFRIIKRPLLANVKGNNSTPIARPNLIMVTSAMPGEGKSFTALNLAMSIAMELDNTVLLVDGDVAQPSLSRMLDLPPANGMIELLTDSRIGLQDVLLRTNVDKLTIMAAGAPNERNTELLASDVMNRLLDDIASRYSDRIIIFDSPPLLPTTESRVLATHMGQVLVVVECQKTTQHKLSQAMATIDACPVVMTVLNKARGSSLGEHYGYYY